MFRSKGHATAVEAALVIDLSHNNTEINSAVQSLKGLSRADLDAAAAELPRSDGRGVVQANANKAASRESNQAAARRFNNR